METIKQLQQQFTGIGEVKGLVFTQLEKSPNCYLYEVRNGEITHYEVFMRKSVPVCVDFENRIYSETEFKEVYPKKNDFGVWAWSYYVKRGARYKFNQLSLTTGKRC